VQKNTDEDKTPDRPKHPVTTLHEDND